MKDGILIRKINMDCPLCDKSHEVEERERSASITIKNEKITYQERYYLCTNAEEDENEFATGAMTNKNLLNARNSYRQKRGLLTSDEIVAIRKTYKLSQVDLARLLGWGEATISRYESTAIQDEAYDTILRLIRDNPFDALALLEKNESKFTPMKKAEIKSAIIDQLDAHGKEYLSRQEFKGEYVNYEDPSDANGFTPLDIDKIEAIASYLAESINNLYKVKLMKFYWYADVLSYIEHGHAMTGMVYTHSTMGALPIGHYKLMNLENLNIQEEITASYEPMQHILPKDNIDYSVLSTQDKHILDRIIKKFKNLDTTAIVNYMHKEKAYKETKSGEVIPFSLAKDIREF